MSQPFTSIDEAKLLLKFTSDEYLCEIGRVITQWSMMETILGQAIWQASGLRNDLGRVVCAQLQVNSLLDTLGAILMQRKPVLGEQFSFVADYVRSCLQGKRNKVAHGMWTTGENYAINLKFTARGQLVRQHSVTTLDELKSLSLEIAEVTIWLSMLIKLLPKLRQRPGGLGHKNQDPPDPQGCATRKLHALQIPTASRKVWEARQALLTTKKPKGPKNPGKRPPKERG